VYFDYKAQQTQTAIDITTNILKQLLSKLDEIPAEVESLYEKSTWSRPDQTVFSGLLTLLAQKFSSIYVVFDALDECNDGETKDILKLFVKLQQSNFRLLISSRPHFYQLRTELRLETCTIEISAEESDLRNYITTRLDAGGNTSEKFKAKCFELINRVEGMQVL
jgi:ATP/maltotriose-dependent transcriptional regulator MalT